MNLKRMQDLLETVEKRPAKRFNMTYWKEKIVSKKGKSCETVACAAGSYVERFPNRGLKFLSYIDTSAYDIRLKSEPRLDGFRALGNHFDIPFELTKWLFLESKYPNYGLRKVSKASVVKRIKEAIQKYSHLSALDQIHEGTL